MLICIVASTPLAPSETKAVSSHDFKSLKVAIINNPYNYKYSNLLKISFIKLGKIKN